MLRICRSNGPRSTCYKVVRLQGLTTDYRQGPSCIISVAAVVVVSTWPPVVAIVTAVVAVHTSRWSYKELFS